MKGKAILLLLVLLLATLALAQTSAPPPGQPEHRMEMEHRTGPMPATGLPMGMGMDMGKFMGPSMELLGEWWKNPEVVTELRLTDAQVKQLEQANLNTRLTLIDSAADGLKAFTRAQALIDSDQFDEAAYNQQVTALSTAAANLVKNLGQTVLTTRRVLSPEQWKKLEALRHGRRRLTQPRPMHPERPMPPPPSQ